MVKEKINILSYLILSYLILTILSMKYSLKRKEALMSPLNVQKIDSEKVRVVRSNHRLNMELDLQSIFRLHVQNCAQLYSLLRPRNSPPPRIWAYIRGRYWPATIDDISLWLPVRNPSASNSFYNCGIYIQMYCKDDIYSIMMKHQMIFFSALARGLFGISLALTYD